MLKRVHMIIVAAVAVLAPVAASASTLSDLSRDISALVRQSSPSVVELRVERRLGAPAFLTPGQAGSRSTTQSVGSGFVIDPAGYILTTAHVVEGAEKIRVRFSDGSEAEAAVTGSDALTNSAVVEVEKAGLKALPLGDSGNLEPGMLVVSINSQAGLEGSVALGTVAATDRKLSGGLEMIQISGTIGPGASGGPVLDPEGRVVGVTSAMLSPSGTALPFNFPSITLQGKALDLSELKEKAKELAGQRKGQDQVGEDWAKSLQESLKQLPGVLPEATREYVEKLMMAAPMAEQFLGAARSVSRTSGSSGFAIPIDQVKPLLDDLKSGREVQRGFLGAALTTKDGRVLIASVEPGGPADKAGIKPGDTLVSADGKPFERVEDFTSHVRTRKPGDRLDLIVSRGGQEVRASVTLGTQPKPKQATAGSGSVARILTPGRVFPLSLVDAGITEVAKAISDASGANVVVTEPEKITKKVTVNLKSVTAEKALDVVCRAMGCTYTKEADAYVVRPK